MNRRTFLFTGAALLPALAAKAEGKGAKLIVHLSYTGSGTVDQSHKIYVVVWDSPDFVKATGESTMPLAVVPVESKSGLARFDDVEKSPVYVSMAYDPTGAWDAQSSPPEGSSLGIYSKEPGVPAPVQLTPGKTTTISVTFDDSHKMSKRQ